VEDQVLKACATEASKIEEDVLYTAKGHFEAAYLWSRAHNCLGIPTAAIAGVSGISALRDEPVVAAALAILASALVSVATFLNPSERAKAHHSAGVKYNTLKGRARRYRDVELLDPHRSHQLTSGLQELAQEKARLDESSPQPSQWARKRARKGIEAGEADYKVDRRKS
jgi:hypothetical protein